jgi:hypothetical protein
MIAGHHTSSVERHGLYPLMKNQPLAVQEHLIEPVPLAMPVDL